MDKQQASKSSQTVGAFPEVRDYVSLQDHPSSMVSRAKQRGLDISNFVSWQWQINHQVRCAADARAYMEISEEDVQGFAASESIFEVGITPYYALLAGASGSDAIRLQALPSMLELEDRHGVDDPLWEKNQSPLREVVHIYPDRVAFCVAQLCPVYCRYCFRKRRDSESGLHFHRQIVADGIDYIASQKSIRDVLITGGDPFLATDAALEDLLQKLRAISHVEVIRFGTRTPVTLPYRITDELTSMLSRYHPIWVNTHFNCAEELSVDALHSLNLLSRAGIPLGNQSVLLRGVNDSVVKMKRLCLSLVKARVRPYYVFHAHLVRGTEHLRVSVSEGLKIMQSLRGSISGFAMPLYIVDTPAGKIPLQRDPILGVDGKDLLLEDPHGEIWREKDAWLAGEAYVHSQVR